MREGFGIERLESPSGLHPILGLALVLVARGELRARLAAGESNRLAAGDVLVVGQGTGGALAARRGGAEAIVFRAQGEWLERALALAGFALESAQPRAATLRAGTEAARRAAICLRELGRTGSGSAPRDPLARAATALELVAIAMAASPESFERPGRRRSRRGTALDAALERLEQAPLQDLTLSRFAAGLGFSDRQASRLVRDRLGLSFGAHVATLRIERARRLLVETELPVIEVAAEAGFGSLSHFNHVFRSRLGGTPSALRAASAGRTAPAASDLRSGRRGAAGERCAGDAELPLHDCEHPGGEGQVAVVAPELGEDARQDPLGRALGPLPRGHAAGDEGMHALEGVVEEGAERRGLRLRGAPGQLVVGSVSHPLPPERRARVARPTAGSRGGEAVR